MTGQEFPSSSYSSHIWSYYKVTTKSKETTTLLLVIVGFRKTDNIFFYPTQKLYVQKECPVH